MKVKTKHDVTPITNPEREWSLIEPIFRLYKWSLYVLRHDAHTGYTDCSAEDAELFIEHTTLDVAAIMYMECVYQMPIKAKRSLKSVCENPREVFDRLKPYIEAVINERVNFGSNTGLGLFFDGYE